MKEKGQKNEVENLAKNEGPKKGKKSIWMLIYLLISEQLLQPC